MRSNAAFPDSRKFKELLQAAKGCLKVHHHMRHNSPDVVVVGGIHGFSVHCSFALPAKPFLKRGLVAAGANAAAAWFCIFAFCALVCVNSSGLAEGEGRPQYNANAA